MAITGLSGSESARSSVHDMFDLSIFSHLFTSVGPLWPETWVWSVCIASQLQVFIKSSAASAHTFRPMLPTSFMDVADRLSTPPTGTPNVSAFVESAPPCQYVAVLCSSMQPFRLIK